MVSKTDSERRKDTLELIGRAFLACHDYEIVMQEAVYQSQAILKTKNCESVRQLAEQMQSYYDKLRDHTKLANLIECIKRKTDFLTNEEVEFLHKARDIRNNLVHKFVSDYWSELMIIWGRYGRDRLSENYIDSAYCEINEYLNSTITQVD